MNERIDYLLWERLQCTDIITSMQTHTDRYPSERIDIYRKRLGEIDSRLKEESADIASGDDFERAQHALDKAKHHGNMEAAVREYDFYSTRALYRFFRGSKNPEDAPNYLSMLHHDPEIVEHIRKGTTPDF